LVRCEIGAEKNSEADLGMKADYQGEDDRSDDELVLRMMREPLRIENG
jgi:hypothetical protein